MAVVSAPVGHAVPVGHAGGMVVAAPAIVDPAYRGLWSWFTTVDHKRIGILYGVSAGTFFVIGGLEALVIRLQLWVPNNTLVTAQTFNSLFTMHALTMIFLAIMPLSAAFFNFIIPLQIGARDVAFPRLNAFSYWAFILGGIMLNISFLLGGAPDAGWFGYANLTTRQYSPGPGIDFWMLGLQVLGVASLAAALNFFVTILNMRISGVWRVGPPHVRCGSGAAGGCGLRIDHYADRRTDGGEDLQLDRHDAPRGGQLQNTDAVLGGLHQHLHHRWIVRDYARFTAG